MENLNIVTEDLIPYGTVWLVPPRCGDCGGSGTTPSGLPCPSKCWRRFAEIVDLAGVQSPSAELEDPAAPETEAH